MNFALLAFLALDPLTPEEVLRSVNQNFPLLLAVLEERRILANPCLFQVAGRLRDRRQSIRPHPHRSPIRRPQEQRKLDGAVLKIPFGTDHGAAATKNRLAIIGQFNRLE